MAANILAFLQFDDNTPPTEPAFSYEASVWSLEWDLGLYGCKDYRFIAAISGIRNESGKPPLIPLRGAPASAAAGIRNLKGEPHVGWLTHSEVMSCLAHFNIPAKDLHHAVINVLDVMQLLSTKCGPERVRLVFAIRD